MWPFGAKRRTTLAGLTAVASVDLTATIVSADDVSSPFSELCAALVWIQVSESMSSGSRREMMDLVRTGADLAHFDGERVLGSIVLGDALVLRSEGGIDVTLCPRRAHLVFAREDEQHRTVATARVSTQLPELEQLLQKAAGREVRYRELGLSCGARVRLRAIVEPISRVSPTTYRSAANPAFAVRDDAEPVTLEELATDGRP